jgi:glycine betaine/choline ABC-type transport system substrate-binding protein
MRRLLLLLAVLAVACGDGPETIVVGSKNFTEQRILGELLAQTLENAGFPVRRRLDLGGTFVCDAALRSGQIDVYVEYTGTALRAILQEEAGGGDAASVLARVRGRYAEAGLTWLDPLGFDNTFALVVRGDEAPETISAAVAPARDWRAAVGYEFEQRADGLPALRRTYDLAFADIRTMDLGLLYQALSDRQVDLVVGSATDGLIDALGLKMLADDRGAFPPYEAVPVARGDTLARHPVAERALRALGGRLDAKAMRWLNHGVDGARRSPAKVVEGWLGNAPRSGID